MPREGSFTLASLGRVTKVQATAFAVVTGRKSVALKRILEAVVESPSARAVRGLLARDVPLALGFFMLSVIIRSFSCAVSLGRSSGIYSASIRRRKPASQPHTPAKKVLTVSCRPDDETPEFRGFF